MYFNGDIKKYSADGVVLDYGALLILPFSNLFNPSLSMKLDNNSTLIPNVNMSFGYSLTNVGDEIYYFDESQKDPLSRTARLGYTLNIGYELTYKDKKIKFIDYSFSAEAEDILVNNRFTDDGYLVPNYETYQNIFGDINIIDHVIGLNPDDKVLVHKGHIFNFFNTVFLTKGSFFGRGYQEVRKTDGFGFSTKGVFNLLNSLIENKTVKFITKHFQLDYHNSYIDFYQGTKTDFVGMSLHFIGFEI